VRALEEAPFFRLVKQHEEPHASRTVRACGDGNPGGWSALTVYADSTVRGMCGYYYVREGMAGQRQGYEVAMYGDE